MEAPSFLKVKIGNYLSNPPILAKKLRNSITHNYGSLFFIIILF